ncbi:MAG: dihydrodipicolinate synthase family protein [Ktedonobacteraceae bacterium]
MAIITLKGIYPPLPTFFDAHEALDLSTYQHHISRLTESGIAGFVVMGTNGEAVHLTSYERAQVIEAAREAAGSHAQIIVGCGDQSTRATIVNCEQAAQSGADVALILPPFYYKGRMNSSALIAHYQTVAANSPLPVVIYNMPTSAAGIDLDAATICTLATHPNIIGVKDSAGNMAKLAQIVATVAEQGNIYFSVFAGSAGYLLPALVVGAVGAVAALANIFPREVCRIQELFNAGQLAEARHLQAALAAANTAVTTTYSVPGLKAALELIAGYGGLPRSPLQPLTEQERRQLATIFKRVHPSTERETPCP